MVISIKRPHVWQPGIWMMFGYSFRVKWCTYCIHVEHVGINELPWYICHPDFQYICHDTVKTEHVHSYLHNQSFTPYIVTYPYVSHVFLVMVISYHIHHPPLRHRVVPVVSPSAPLSLHRAVESEGGPKREDVAGWKSPRCRGAGFFGG